jgi:predicted DNA-binding transcriptional regulator AlpA
MASPADQRREYLTDQQLCDLLHVNPRTSMRWRRDGGGPPFIRVGERRVLYRASDVNSWLAARTFAHRAAEAVAA